MPYLTYEEFEELSSSDIDETEFDNLLPKASGVLDYVTLNFYHHVELEKDHKVRRDKFKLALASQIEYFDYMGATTSHELNNPLSVQIGRTQMSMGERNQQRANQNANVSEDVYFYLTGTGLLYRGVHTI